VGAWSCYDLFQRRNAAAHRNHRSLGGELIVDLTRLDSIAAIGIRHLVRVALALRRVSRGGGAE